MKYIMRTIACAAFIVITSNLSANAEDVGFTRLTVEDPMGGKMQVSLWYPTSEPSELITVGPYKFQAARDAQPINMHTSLVVMSHGTEGSDLGHRNVAISLAQMGTIVAAPLHPRDNFKDNSGVGRRIVMEGRPRQLSAVIDVLLSHDEWGKRIDADRIGAFGFSLGGYTVLAALGARPEMMRVVNHCETSTVDPFCAFVADDTGSLRNQVEQEYKSPMTNLADPRLCVASIVDPVAVPFSNEALSTISAHYIEIWRPEEQNVLLANAHAGRVVQQLNKRPNIRSTQEVVVKGAQHYSFLAPFPWKLSWLLPRELTRDSSQFDRSKFQEKFATDVTNFLHRNLTACSR